MNDELLSASFDEIKSGITSDIYFHRTKSVLQNSKINTSNVVMEIFSKGEGIVSGISEALTLLRSLKSKNLKVWSVAEGAAFSPRHIIMRIQGEYTEYGMLETAILGVLASGSGWATAARKCTQTANSVPVLSFGARHIHPAVVPCMEYAAVIGGCASVSTIKSGRVTGLFPSGTMPHALILLIGDTLKAAIQFDKIIARDVRRIVLVDTFKDEVEESLRIAKEFNSENSTTRENLFGVRLDTPQERGGVTPELVTELRIKLDNAGFDDVKIFISGGITPERIKKFNEYGHVDGYGVGSYISGAKPIDFTADIKQINGIDVAKRGRIPGILNDYLPQVI